MFSPDSDWKTFHVKYVDEQLFNISVCHDAPCDQILATFREWTCEKLPKMVQHQHFLTFSPNYYWKTFIFDFVYVISLVKQLFNSFICHT